MASKSFVLQPGRLTLADLRRIERDEPALALVPECRGAIERGCALIAAVVEAGAPTYGVNTGLGTLSRRSIAAGDLEEMQRRLLLSNAAGTGPLLPETWRLV